MTNWRTGSGKSTGLNNSANPSSLPIRASVKLCGGVGIANGHSFQPILNNDGTLVGFASNATNLLSACGDTNGLRDIFIRKISAPTSSRRFSDSAGVQATGGNSSNPDISNDGNVAIYESLATNLLGAGQDTNGAQDIFQNFSPQGMFIRGDVDLNGKIDISDSIRIFNWLSSNGPPPGCYDAADANDNGAIEQSDGIYINNYLFNGGQAPLCPFCRGASPPFTSCCGKDPTGDGLPCGVTLPGRTSFAADGSCPPH